MKTPRCGAGLGVLDLGVLMRKGGKCGVGVSGTPKYGAGLGVLGLGVPTVVGSVGWGVLGGLRDPQIWGWGLGAGLLGVPPDVGQGRGLGTRQGVGGLGDPRDPLDGVGGLWGGRTPTSPLPTAGPICYGAEPHGCRRRLPGGPGGSLPPPPNGELRPPPCAPPDPPPKLRPPRRRPQHRPHRWVQPPAP